MPKQLVFISGREHEMRHFREAAERAIAAAGMKHVYVESKTVLRSVDVARQIEDAVRSAHVFVGLYGYTLNTNAKPEGSDKHYLELEFGWAGEAGLPRLCYAPQGPAAPEHAAFYDPPRKTFDRDMRRFRDEFLKYGIGWLTTPQALHDDLLGELKKLKPNVFLSYSSEDAEFVKSLYGQLKGSGYRPWFNAADIPPAADWKAEMLKGLAETSVIVLVVSPGAMGSKWVRKEWETFVESGKPVLQLIYKKTETPRKLKAIQGIKLEGNDRWYYDLLREIKVWL